MGTKNFSLDAIKVVRSIRGGVAKPQICDTYRIDFECLRTLEQVYQSVPDRELASMERTLGDNEKLRKLVAGLIRQYE